MKIITTDLRSYLTGYGTIERTVEKMNTLQEIVSPGKRPITRNAIYHYLGGHTPTLDKIYLLSAVLGVHPKTLFTISYDDEKYKTYREVMKNLPIENT